MALEEGTLVEFLQHPPRFASSFGYPLLLVWSFLRSRFPDATSSSAPQLEHLPSDSALYALLLRSVDAQGGATVRGHLAVEISVGFVSPLPEALSLRLSSRNALEAACAAAVEGEWDRFDERLRDLSHLRFKGAEIAAAVAARAVEHFLRLPLEQLSSLASQVAARFPSHAYRPLVELSLLTAVLSHSTLVPSLQLPSTRLLLLSVAGLCEGRAVELGAPPGVWGSAARRVFAELLPSSPTTPGEVASADPLPAGGLVGFYGERYLLQVGAYRLFPAAAVAPAAPEGTLLLLSEVGGELSAAWVRSLEETPAGPALVTLPGTAFVVTADEQASGPPPLLEGDAEMLLSRLRSPLPPLPS